MKRLPNPATQQPGNFLNIVDSATVFSCCRRMVMANNGAAVFTFGTEQKMRPVTNLGWLLRNWREVHDLHVWTFYSYFGLPRNMRSVPQFDAILAARMVGCRVYATTFADKSVLAQWLCRPVLRGRPVYWNGRAYITGSTDYINDFVRNQEEPV